jgi:N-acetylated-alpha-linked acidic dipeptidase
MKLLIAGFLSFSLLAAEKPIRGFPPEQCQKQHQLEQTARSIPEPARIRQYVEHISAEPHHAGSPGSKAVAEYLLGLLKEWGLDARIETFESLLPYPTKRKVILESPVKYVAGLKEPKIPEDPDSGDEGQLPTYNAYSASGDVVAPLVYVNYGVPEDYEVLQKQGIDVKGKIVIARYGKSWRGTKPKVAYEHGAVGCLIYSDPRDDGYFKGDVYPKGPFRPWRGVQRGSVMDMPLYVGDPLSPGWASEKGSRRLSLSEAKTLMKIPDLPLSYQDAIPLLENLGGPVAPEPWRGALPLTYHLGPGPATVRLEVESDSATRPVYDVIATIRGSEFPDQWVIYGNHHDAWVNGAQDPVSGASALLETARTLAEMTKKGWQPKRTIVLAFWDAEEFGLIGSTEWTEKHLPDLDKKAVAYINTDSNGKGWIHASGSQTLEKFMREVLRDVPDPVTSKSLLEVAQSRRDPDDEDEKPSKEFRLGPLGAGSDYVAFFDHGGIASLNVGISGDSEGGIYHSIYDSFYWYTHFSDADFVYGKALSQVTTTSLLRLADAPVLPFDFAGFSKRVKEYVEDIQKLAKKKPGDVDLNRVLVELAKIDESARKYDEELERSMDKIPAASVAKLAHVNELLYRSERALTAPQGLPGRDWYKNQIYAPGVYTGYSAKTLPGIREAVEGSRWDEAAQQAKIVAQVLQALNAQIQEATRALESL